MKYLLLTILLLSCSKQVLTVSEPIADAPAAILHEAPSFVLGMPFEGGSVVDPVMSIPVWAPVVDKPKIVRASIRVDTVVLCDTVIKAGPVVRDTIYVQKIVHSRGLAYLMLVIGFVAGIFIAVLLLYISQLNKNIDRDLHFLDKINRKRKR